jgi:hypothetical protein
MCTPKCHYYAMVCDSCADRYRNKLDTTQNTRTMNSDKKCWVCNRRLTPSIVLSIVMRTVCDSNGFISTQRKSYLQKSVFHSHGHLTSAQCYVDSRWVLKIGGFSLHAFRDNNSEKSITVLVRTFVVIAPQLRCVNRAIKVCITYLGFRLQVQTPMACCRPTYPDSLI